jgi:hypothetical protein
MAPSFRARRLLQEPTTKKNQAPNSGKYERLLEIENRSFVAFRQIAGNGHGNDNQSSQLQDASDLVTHDKLHGAARHSGDGFSWAMPSRKRERRPGAFPICWKPRPFFQERFADRWGRLPVCRRRNGRMGSLPHEFPQRKSHGPAVSALYTWRDRRHENCESFAQLSRPCRSECANSLTGTGGQLQKLNPKSVNGRSVRLLR